MNATESAMYRASYDLHRLYYETPEESRDADFWRQIREGIAEVGKHNSQGPFVQVLIQDVAIPYEQHENHERARASHQRTEAAAREREEAAKAEARSRKQAEIDRLERELAQARAGL